MNTSVFNIKEREGARRKHLHGLGAEQNLRRFSTSISGKTTRDAVRNASARARPAGWQPQRARKKSTFWHGFSFPPCVQNCFVHPGKVLRHFDWMQAQTALARPARPRRRPSKTGHGTTARPERNRVELERSQMSNPKCSTLTAAG